MYKVGYGVLLVVWKLDNGLLFFVYFVRKNVLMRSVFFFFFI